MSAFLVGIVDEFILYYGYYITPRDSVYLLIINNFFELLICERINWVDGVNWK